MDDSTTPHSRSRAIVVNLQALRIQLHIAVQQANEACEFAESGEQNCAIGALVSLGAILDDAQGLHRAAIALHCMNLRPPILQSASTDETSQVGTAPDRSDRGCSIRFGRFFNRLLRRE